MPESQNTAELSANITPPTSVSLSVALSCTHKNNGRWQYEKTELAAVAPCNDENETLSSEQNGASMTLWRGLKLHLNRESCESYWANVSTDSPRLFVVCRKENGETRPVCITASGEEAAGYGETDDEILSAPMPQWIVEPVEQFVIAHYRPEEKKVRKRK